MRPTLTEIVTAVNAALAVLPGSAWQSLCVAVPMQPGQGQAFKTVEIATELPALLDDTGTTSGFHRSPDAQYVAGAGRGAGNRYTKAARVYLLVYSADLAIVEKVETLLAGVAGVELNDVTTDPARVNSLLLGLQPQTHNTVSRLLAAFTYTATVQVAACLPS